MFTKIIRINNKYYVIRNLPIIGMLYWDPESNSFHQVPFGVFSSAKAAQELYYAINEKTIEENVAS